VAIAVICVAILPARVMNYALNDARAYATTLYEPWANKPELANYFSENVDLQPGQAFRGAVSLDRFARPIMPLLWLHAIPTINEYSQLVTPEPFYFAYALLLPQRFSHCLRARDSSVRFVRANLMMAGMIFAGDIDTDSYSITGFSLPDADSPISPT
jgi:hypothetical protein